MQDGGVDLRQAIMADAVTLFGMKRMTGLRHLDSRSHSVVSEVELYRMVERVWIAWQDRTNGARERTDVIALLQVERIRPSSEVAPADFYPYDPDKRTALAIDRDLEAPANEEPLSINDTIIGSQRDAVFSLCLGNPLCNCRGIESKRRHAGMDFGAGGAAELEAHSCDA